MKPTLCQLVTRVTDRKMTFNQKYVLFLWLSQSSCFHEYISDGILSLLFLLILSISLYMPQRAVSTVTGEFPEFQKRCTTEMFPSSSGRISKYILGVQKPNVSTDVMQTGTNQQKTNAIPSTVEPQCLQHTHGQPNRQNRAWNINCCKITAIHSFEQLSSQQQHQYSMNSLIY